jgi:hypothetical protein
MLVICLCNLIFWLINFRGQVYGTVHLVYNYIPGRVCSMRYMVTGCRASSFRMCLETLPGDEEWAGNKAYTSCQHIRYNECLQ